MNGAAAMVMEAPLYSRDHQSENTIVTVGSLPLGDDRVIVIGGPCAVEDQEMLDQVATEVKRHGGALLRGGAFKPRTSHDSFQGHGQQGLHMLERARRMTGLPIVTELLDIRDTVVVAKSADVIQVGSRNMQNTPLLREVGRLTKPVLLKRGMSRTLDEFASAAEYILQEGNMQVILCERGSRVSPLSSECVIRFRDIMDLKKLTHLPIVVDPSHAARDPEDVIFLAKHAILAGADGLLVEVHPNPAKAKCDGKHALTPEMFGRMMEECRLVAAVIGRSM